MDALFSGVSRLFSVSKRAGIDLPCCLVCLKCFLVSRVPRCVRLDFLFVQNVALCPLCFLVCPEY